MSERGQGAGGAAVPPAAPTAFRVLVVEADPLSGEIEVEGVTGSRKPFAGWIDLIAAIRAGSGAPAAGPKQSPVAGDADTGPDS